MKPCHIVEVATCLVCSLAIFLVGASTHPCCRQALARGESDCGACRAFKIRERR